MLGVIFLFKHVGNFHNKSTSYSSYKKFWVVENCYFTIGNMVFKQDIGILIGIYPAPFWSDLFLSFYESKHAQNLISKKSTAADKYHATSRFIDDEEFSKSFKWIYPG